MSGCFFCVEDHCVFRDLMKSAKEDCEFMGEDRGCNATEENLVDFPFGEEEWETEFSNPDYDDTGLDGCEPGKSIRRLDNSLSQTVKKEEC